MAELHHRSHHHPLLFNKDTTRPSYFCYGCDKRVQGPSYSCEECRFYLHKSCAEAPSEIDDHPPLLLLPPSEDPETKVCCSFCRNYNKVEGFIYGCSCCEFFLDINCALLGRGRSGKFIETVHVAHPHPLVSINRFGYFYCEICRDSILDDASYACFECREFFHKQCIELPSTINHPCHRRHQLLLADVLDVVSNRISPECNLCQRSILFGYYYRCVPCRVNIHSGCAWPPPIVEDKSRHVHPFTLLLRPNKVFDCDACGNQGTYVSYVCSTCNIQVHKDCVSLPRHIRLNLHPHPISHCFFIRTDHHDSRDWDCKICFKKVDIDHGSYYCSRPGCDFIIHVKCSIENDALYDVVEVQNLNQFEESDEPVSSIVRVIKEIKVGDDVIAGEIEHVSHKHNLVFSDEIKDNKYCNGCVLPIISWFYYCSQCDFFLHKTCAELQRMCRLWFKANPFRLLTDGIFTCTHCRYTCSGFSYKMDYSCHLCLRCALVPHSFTYQADKPHFIFYVDNYRGDCSACGESCFFRDRAYICKDCTFVVHRRCVTLPRTAWHKCDQHSLTLTFQDGDDYPLRHYCDICEKERDPKQWFYHCETCDKAMHIKCVFGEHPFINAGNKYTQYKHPRPLTSVRKIYYYPPCNDCGKPCQDLALECVDHGCEYIIHWTCIETYNLNTSSE